MDPEGILKGSIAKVLITPAIKSAQKRALKLLTKEDLRFFNYYRRNRMFFCICQSNMDNKISIIF